MQWTEDSSRDAHMLGRVDLTPLSTVPTEGDESLARLVERHNAATVALTGRFGKLVNDRQAIANADKWVRHDSKAVIAERRRIIAESWDVLVALHSLLDERQNVLRTLEAHVAARHTDLRERQDRALDKARKALAKEHRDLLKAEPKRGGEYVDDLAEDDDAVSELRRQAGALMEVLESLRSASYKAGNTTPITIRQRELYEQLN